MAEVKDMYRIARFVDSDKYDPPRKQYKNPGEAVADCANLYAKRFGLSKRKAKSILENALDHKYIKVIGDDPIGYVLIVTSGRGRRLIAKKWFIYPSGLVEESAKVYKETRAMIKSVAVILASIISAAIGSIVTYILSN